jgi:hypothetical protein
MLPYHTTKATPPTTIFSLFSPLLSLLFYWSSPLPYYLILSTTIFLELVYFISHLLLLFFIIVLHKEKILNLFLIFHFLFHLSSIESVFAIDFNGNKIGIGY